MLKVRALLFLFSLVLHSMASHDKHDCNTHQKFATCGTACPENCNNYGTEASLFCSTQCVTGCFCVSPYIFKKGNSGECILPDHCPRKFSLN
ncbi:chymotrypsin inhibitor-like [Phyllobates terribilis]|uniref:chymotrypsin inhibitor-like n=1 Tax=Phyllobates terribilis TaxID=111132 RepID=UPI003CCAF332